MKTFVSKMFVVFAALCLVSMLSWPAAAQPRQSQQQQSQQEQQNLKDLKGQKIQNEQGKDVGKVKDIVIGQNGRIQSVIIEEGGVLGIGEKEQRIPWSALQQGPNSTLIYSGGQPTQPAAQQQTGPGQQEISLSKIEGKTVKDSQGKDLGKIQEVVAAQDGEAYAVIEGNNSKYYPVGLQQLKISGKNENQVQADFTQQMMQAGPGFAKDQWKNMSAQQWQPQVRAYYGGQQPQGMQNQQKSDQPMVQQPAPKRQQPQNPQ